MRRIVLLAENGPDGLCHVSADVTKDGTLHIRGQDLGPGVAAFFGDGFNEYEWDCSVRAEDVPSLVVALGGERGDDVLDVLARRSADIANQATSFLKQHNIHFEFWSRVGD